MHNKSKNEYTKTYNRKLPEKYEGKKIRLEQKYLTVKASWSEHWQTIRQAVLPAQLYSMEGIIPAMHCV